MEAGILRQVVAERCARWADAGISWQVLDGPSTDKPASRLVRDAGAALGQLVVWVSGEAVMDWGTPDRGGTRQYVLSSRDDVWHCVDDLEAALRVL